MSLQCVSCDVSFNEEGMGTARGGGEVSCTPLRHIFRIEFFLPLDSTVVLRRFYGGSTIGCGSFLFVGRSSV